MSTEMRARLGINNCFAVRRWPQPGDWASIVANNLGLDTVELSLDLRTCAEVWARALAERGLR
jgi:hypothetical protein